MIYQPTKMDIPIEVDVYNIQHNDELSCYALMWNLKTKMWMLMPISTVRPIEDNKKSLVE
jgi:hypothetical protein